MEQTYFVHECKRGAPGISYTVGGMSFRPRRRRTKAGSEPDMRRWFKVVQQSWSQHFYSMQMSAQICEPFLQNIQLAGLDARKSNSHSHVREDEYHSA